MSSTDRFVKNNAERASSVALPYAASPPSLKIAVVTCMDARLDPARFLGIDLGEAHVIRNAGGIVTDDVLRSLLLSQRGLGTTEIMVIQHTKCGVRGLDEAELLSAIEAETGTTPEYSLGSFADLEESVRDGLARIRAESVLPHRDAVRGFVYDVDSGQVREVE